jgi:hypothetical protein
MIANVILVVVVVVIIVVVVIVLVSSGVCLFFLYFLRNSLNLAGAGNTARSSSLHRKIHHRAGVLAAGLSVDIALAVAIEVGILFSLHAAGLLSLLLSLLPLRSRFSSPACRGGG